MHVPDEITSIIKRKASNSDVKHLHDIKTNKQDTESHMRNMVTMHKMLESVIVLLTESYRIGTDHKLQSETGKLSQNK